MKYLIVLLAITSLTAATAPVEATVAMTHVFRCDSWKKANGEDYLPSTEAVITVYERDSNNFPARAYWDQKWPLRTTDLRELPPENGYKPGIYITDGYELWLVIHEDGTANAGHSAVVGAPDAYWSVCSEVQKK